MNKQYFIRERLYKKPVTGNIIEYNQREFGIHKGIGELVITDILTGLRINISGSVKTKTKAVDYIKTFDLKTHEKTLKDGEAIFNTLPEYDFNKVYIRKREFRNNETSFYEGEYKGKQFEITISIYKIGYEIDYFEGDFSIEEETEITEQILNYNRDCIKV